MICDKKMSEPHEKTIRMRIYVLKEILKTEKDYVETLQFLVHVFMERLKSREEDENDKVVPIGTVELLLSNIEKLYEFHQEMLKSIEEALSPEPQFKHEIGKVFLSHKKQFLIYEPYCTNHEKAQKKLNELTENEGFHSFILGCLLLGNYVNDVSMEGFLLTPIQRICKYPLLLKELLKKTPNDHSDYNDVKAACEMMKEVCSNVNETKRQLEQLEKLEEIQASFTNWEGVNLTDVSTRLIKQGPLLKISVGNFQERQVFLFDHLLVYAKKINNLPRLQGTAESKTGTIRRGRTTKAKQIKEQQKKWIFKGRISTELMEIENLEDGANDYHCGGSSVTNAWKVLNAAKNKWFVLVAKSKEDKESWLNEFILEREKRKSKVSLEQRDSLDVTHARGKKLYYRLTHQKVIRDRKHKMRVQPKCFPGSELVTWLTENKEANSTDEAVMFGQALIDCGLIHHVSDKYHFRNESVYYRFRYDDGTFKQRGENQDLVAKGLRVHSRLHSLFQPVIRDKDKNWKNHKYVVEGKKLIDWLVEQGDCQNRDEASNFGQTMCENGILHHASDKQDFKDDASLFRFFPDEEVLDIYKSREHSKKSSKQEFRLQEEYQTKTLLLLNVTDSENIGIELKYSNENSQVIIDSVEKGSPAQVQGFKPGMVIVQINNIIVTSCPSEEVLQKVIKYNLDKYKMVHFVVIMEVEQQINIPVTVKGMGFQIKGSNPSVVHSVSKGSAAMTSGLQQGHAIFKINGKVVANLSHDEVAGAIREGCSIRQSDPATKEEETRKEESAAEVPEEEVKSASSNSLSTPSAIKRVKSIRLIRHKGGNINKDKRVVTPNVIPKNGLNLKLLVGNRHLERTCVYTFISVNGVKNNVVEKMSETPSIFDLASQLLDVLAKEDTKVLDDVQKLEKIADDIASVKLEVVERRRTLRFDVIQERLENYNKYKRHLLSYMWPSYKMVKNRPSRLTAKDFCPTNCHVNLLTVSHIIGRYNLKGFGLVDSKGENELLNVENLVNTTHCVTCVAAPSYKAKGMEGRGLMAVLRSSEGNTELMDSVRHQMVALDFAIEELKRGQQHLTSILQSEAKERDKRNSLQSQSRDSYQGNGEISFPVPVSLQLDPVTTDKQKSVENPEMTQGEQRLPHLKEFSIPEESGENDIQNSQATTNGETKRESKPVFDISVESPSFNDSSPRHRRHNDLESVAGHESECDSGIQSNRGSLADHDKLTFSFSNTNPCENSNDNQDSDDKTNRTSGISTTNSSDRLSVTDDLKTIKGAISMPSLTAESQNGSISNSIKSPKKRPRSGRNNASHLSTAGSTCSSEGLDSLNFYDLDLSPDGLDKLHGTMEHFLNKIQALGALIKSDVIKTVFEITKETTPNRDYNKIIERFSLCTSREAFKMSLTVCNDVEQVSELITTLMNSVEQHVSDIRIQLVLAVLLHEDPKLVARRDKVFCQALTTAISAFSIQLRCALAGTFNNMKAYGVRSEEASRKWLEQCMSIGACIIFQTMLNLNEANELAMLQDSAVGVYDLERVAFHFKALTGKVEPNECPFNVNFDFDGSSTVHVDGNGVGYSMEGNRCALKINFHLEKHIFIKLPPRLQAGGGVKLIPILVNHGLQDLGSSLYEQEVTMQKFSNSINEKAYDKIYEYYKRFRAFHFDRSKLPRDTEARAVLVDKLSRPLNALDEVVCHIENNVKLRHGMPDLTASGCGILPLVGEYCQRIGACSIAACNSGVHRSTASCSLQQSLALATSHGLPPKHLLSAAYQMAKLGARPYNEKKNIDASYRCSSTVPRLYRLFFEDPEVKSPS